MAAGKLHSAYMDIRQCVYIFSNKNTIEIRQGLSLSLSQSSCISGISLSMYYEYLSISLNNRLQVDRKGKVVQRQPEGQPYPLPSCAAHALNKPEIYGGVSVLDL